MAIKILVMTLTLLLYDSHEKSKRRTRQTLVNTNLRCADREYYTIKSFLIVTVLQIIIGMIKSISMIQAYHSFIHDTGAMQGRNEKCRHNFSQRTWGIT
jgi:hypothetical protein